MKIENMPLFTEYERQFKRKYPTSNPSIRYEDNLAVLTFEYVFNGKAYMFRMKAPSKAVNGYVNCYIYMGNDNVFTIEFDESRKPMEMNVDNAVNATKCLFEKLNRRQ